MRTGKLFISPYGDELRIVITKKFSEAKDYYLKNKPKEFNEDVSILENTYENGGACFYSCSDLHFVFFSKRPKPHIVVHECVHLANKVLFRRGLPLVPESEEAYTYLVQYLFKEITSFAGLKLEI